MDKRVMYKMMCWILLCGTGAVLFFNGCTRVVSVSEADFQPDSSSAAGEQEAVEYQGDYIFHMGDGREINPARFTVKDSSFVISEIYDGRKSVHVDTLVLFMNEVESIERISLWKPSIFIVAVPIAGLAVLFWIMRVSMSGLG